MSACSFEIHSRCFTRSKDEDLSLSHSRRTDSGVGTQISVLLHHPGEGRDLEKRNERGHGIVRLTRYLSTYRFPCTSPALRYLEAKPRTLPLDRVKFHDCYLSAFSRLQNVIYYSLSYFSLICLDSNVGR